MIHIRFELGVTNVIVVGSKIVACRLHNFKVQSLYEDGCHLLDYTYMPEHSKEWLFESLQFQTD